MVTDKFFVESEKAFSLISMWKDEGLEVVFTNGCFDLLHRGHLTYLADASKLGDRLVIGLNSDTSVHKLKGENRPIHKQDDRAFHLLSLSFVDAVVLFEEDTPEKLINLLGPDILVKGGDYKLSDIVGREKVLELGGQVLTIPFIDGYSTTGIIDKIKKS